MRLKQLVAVKGFVGRAEGGNQRPGLILKGCLRLKPHRWPDRASRARHLQKAKSGNGLGTSEKAVGGDNANACAGTCVGSGIRWHRRGPSCSISYICIDRQMQFWSSGEIRRSAAQA